MTAHIDIPTLNEPLILETPKSPTYKRKRGDEEASVDSSKRKRTKFQLPIPKHSDLYLNDIYAIDIHEDDIKKLPYDALTSKKFVQVAAGIRHYAAIDECGQVWTWGYSNENGALGR